MRRFGSWVWHGAVGLSQIIGCVLAYLIYRHTIAPTAPSAPSIGTHATVHAPSMLDSPLFLALLALLLVSGLGDLWVSYTAFKLVRATEQETSGTRTWTDLTFDQMEHVRDKHFLNESVELDGRGFQRCTFTNVQLVFHGTKSFVTEECAFGGLLTLKTDDAASANWIRYLEALLVGFKMIDGRQLALDNNSNVLIIPSLDLRLPSSASGAASSTAQNSPSPSSP